MFMKKFNRLTCAFGVKMLRTGLITLGLMLNASSHATHLLEAEKAIAEQRATIEAYRAYRLHPLYPYLEFQHYRLHHQQIPNQTLLAFLREHQHAPYAQELAQTLYPAWLAARNYAAIIQSYQPSFTHEKHQCPYYLAQFATKRILPSADEIKTLWLKARKIDESCTPLFEQLQQQGKLDTALISQRIAKLMQDNQFELARKVAARYQADIDSILQTWINIYQQKQSVDTVFALPTFWRAAILAHLGKTFKPHTLRLNVAIFLKSHQQGDFANQPQLQKLAFNRLTRQFAKDDDALTPHLWQALASSEPEFDTILDVIAYAQRHALWHELPNWLAQLDNSQIQRAEIQYWLAKSYEKIGQMGKAQQHYRQAAKQRDFYGFIAAEKLGLPYALNAKIIEKKDDIYHEVIQNPAVYRLQLLFALGQTQRAKKEWQALIQGLTPAQAEQLIYFAQENGWWQLAITSLAELKTWDALVIRFPLHYQAQIEKLAQYHQISPAQIFAIIRKESIFQADIRSPAGALGLMQVMPKTAKETARKYQLPQTLSLTNPEYNLQIGSQYLTEQLNRYPHFAHAAAAYNAGPGASSRWLKDYAHLPLDEWILHIPYTETRDYVKRVLEYQKIYEYRLKLPYQPIGGAHLRLW